MGPNGSTVLQNPKSVNVYFRCIHSLTCLFHTLCSLDIPQLFNDHLLDWFQSLTALLKIDSDIPTGEVFFHHFFRLLLLHIQNFILRPDHGSLIVRTQSQVLDILNLMVSQYQEDISPSIDSIAAIVRTFNSTIKREDPYKERV